MNDFAKLTLLTGKPYTFFREHVVGFTPNDTNNNQTDVDTTKGKITVQESEADVNAAFVNAVDQNATI